jgi:type I restriction enzyme S subunit
MELKPGYKQTEVGVIPEGWEVKQLGEIASIKTGPFGSALHERDYVQDGTPIITVEHLDDFGVLHSDLPMVSGSDKRRLSAYTLESDDIVFSRVGAIDRNALIRQAEVGWLFSGRLLRVRLNSGNVFAPYLSYHFHDTPFKLRVKSVAVGQTMASLNTQILRGIDIVLPPLPEQRAIAAALGDVDALIGTLDRLIVKKRDLKQAAMQQLLTGQTRLPGFHGEWEVKRLGELLEYEQPTKYLVKDSEYSDENDVPVLTAGKTFVLGYTNEENGIFNNLPVIIFDDFTTANKYVTFPFKAKSSAMKILKPRDTTVNLRLVFEAMQLIKFPLGDHKRYWISEYRNLEIKIPKADEQTAIAAALSDMDAEIAALEARRDKTRALKQGMMQELLTGRTRLI